MIPILFESTETTFTRNGIGRLAEATACEVTEERNGQYELLLKYPVDGKYAEDLRVGRFIYATHDESKVPQAFQIYSVSKPIEGFYSVRAWHISYMLNGIVLAPFTAGSCAATIGALSANSIGNNPFTFWTDKNVVGDFKLAEPSSVRAVLGGTSGSILDVYGTGEYEFDMWTVKLHVHRGIDRGVEIRYGKNLTKLDQALDGSNVYNSVVPYWTNADGDTVYSPTLVTRSGETPGRAIVLDLTPEFAEAPTVAQLQAKAQTIIDSSTAYQIRDNIKVDYVALWQTEEYKDYANLQRIQLCDTVSIVYTKLGITAKAKCIKTVYDSLLERYTKLELGEPQVTLAQQIRDDVVGDMLGDIPSKSFIQSAIDKATEMITGGFGGYIKFNYLSDGTPSEMLIMNTPDESTATNIIRLNQNGIGFSTNGGATYANAWTIDGNLNASFITTGVLNAARLTAGIIQDATAKNYWNLDTGQFNTTQGTIGSFTIDSTGLYSGSTGVGQTGSKIYPGFSEYALTVGNTTQKLEVSPSWLSEYVSRNGDPYQQAFLVRSGLPNGVPTAYIATNSGETAHIILQNSAQNTIDPIVLSYNTAVRGSLSANSLSLSNALPISSGGTGATSALQARQNLWLYTGGASPTIGSTEVICVADISHFSAFVMVGVPSSNYQSTCFIPKSALSTSITKWQVADESRYIGVELRIIGSSLYGRVAASSTSGKTVNLYGLYGA